MDNIIFSLNAIFPMLILVVLGMLLKKIKFAEQSFFSACDKLGFRLCLPCLLFLDTVDASFTQVDTGLIIFCAIFLTVIFLLSGLLVPLFLKNNSDRGAFIQGICRSNVAILGAPLAESMFGQAGTAAFVTVLPISIALYNIYSVIVLSVFAPQEKRPGGKAMLAGVMRNVMTNPLILAVLAAAVCNVSGTGLPVAVRKSIAYFADMAVPLALLSLGAGFSLKTLQTGVFRAACASCIKTILFPLAGVSAAGFLGIEGIGLGIVFILGGGPTAISSYVMAKQMDSNYDLAGEIVLLSTLMSAFTMFMGVFILKEMRLI